MRKAFALLAAAVAVSVLAAAVGAALTPSTADLQARVEAQARAGNALVVEPGGVPALFVNLLVSTEDERFFEHHGLDVIGLGRAVVYDAANACLCQGGSTITQQLVKQLYLGASDQGSAKVLDMVLALKVEAANSKAAILADYLNVVLFGYGVVGAQTASCVYFGRRLDQLNLAQSALIAGMPQGPALYDPRLHPHAATHRRAIVLELSRANGYITAAEAAAAAAEPLALAAPGTACAP